MSKTDDSIPQILRDIETQAVKVIKKLPRRDLDYTVQVSIHSLRKRQVNWAVQITQPAEGLAPITFIKENPQELIEQLKAFAKEIDYDKVEVAYHEAQIKSAKKTIEGHEERIKEIKREKEESKEN